MAAGVTPLSPLSHELRNHLVVPGDHANVLLEAATSLEEHGALTTSPEDAQQVVRGENVTFTLTAIGTQMVRSLSASLPALSGGLGVESEGGPRSRAIEHLLAAQGHLIEARTSIESLDPKARSVHLNLLGATTMFLGLLGEAVYQLRNPARDKRAR